MNPLTTLILCIILIIICWVIGTINTFIMLNKAILQGKSVVDVFLKKRYDLIPNLVETVKGYAKYEEETLKEIVSLRNSFDKDMNSEAGEKLNDHYKKMIALVESYPELKASDNFLQLQKSLSKVESEIQAARRIYINNITTYNTKIQKFPSSIVANLFGYTEKELPKFEIEEVNINF